MEKLTTVLTVPAVLKLITLGEIDDVLQGLAASHGYFTFPFGDYPCCQRCGVYDATHIHEAENYLFFNYQSYQHSFDNYPGEDWETEKVDETTVVPAKREDWMFHDLGLTWSGGVDLEAVKAAFSERGITITGGDLDKKLVVEKIRFVQEAVA